MISQSQSKCRVYLHLSTADSCRGISGNQRLGLTRRGALMGVRFSADGKSPERQHVEGRYGKAFSPWLGLCKCRRSFHADIGIWNNTRPPPYGILRMRGRIRFPTVATACTTVESAHGLFNSFSLHWDQPSVERTDDAGGTSKLFWCIDSNYRDRGGRVRHRWIEFTLWATLPLSITFDPPVRVPGCGLFCWGKRDTIRRLKMIGAVDSLVVGFMKRFTRLGEVESRIVGSSKPRRFLSGLSNKPYSFQPAVCLCRSCCSWSSPRSV